MNNNRFEIRDKFYLDGKPFQIISGSLHYFRVVPEYWRDRLEKLRAMGCNTVETYLPWNLHEPRRGEFCFEGMLDLAAFLKTAQELGLWAIVRPSPYACGEWEFGGLPAWLLAEDGMRLRCSYPPFLAAVREYYRALFQVLAPLQITRGGPVILMQVENEYGSFGSETAYLEALRDEMRRNGAEVPLITSDGPTDDLLNCGGVPGALPTANFGSKADAQLDVLQRHVDGGPLMCTEFWVGWFDAWGDKAHHTAPAESAAKDLDRILARGSVNMYLFHGGTSFGFMNGANYYENFSPDVTSYDYDAPLSEDGQITPKYMAFREVIGKYRPLPDMKFSTRIVRRAYGRQKAKACVSLFRVLRDLAQPVENPWPLCMEKLGQSYGYILYSSEWDSRIPIDSLCLIGAADRAQIFFDEQPRRTLYDHELQQECRMTPGVSGVSRMEILVENMGRVNYGPRMDVQRKGIDGAVWVNRHGHAGWKMYSLPMDQAMLEKLDFSKGCGAEDPSFSEIPFLAEEPADTFLDMTGWGKGCVFLNGFNLGRFWEKGPQKRLYIPAPLLRRGENRLIVFETEGKRADCVSLEAEPAL